MYQYSANSVRRRSAVPTRSRRRRPTVPSKIIARETAELHKPLRHKRSATPFRASSSPVRGQDAQAGTSIWHSGEDSAVAAARPEFAGRWGQETRNGFRLPNPPGRAFLASLLLRMQDHHPKPRTLHQTALHEGPPFNFSVPPGRGIRDRALGPWPKKLGRWAAAALPIRGEPRCQRAGSRRNHYLFAHHDAEARREPLARAIATVLESLTRVKELTLIHIKED